VLRLCKSGLIKANPKKNIADSAIRVD